MKAEIYTEVMRPLSGLRWKYKYDITVGVQENFCGYVDSKNVSCKEKQWKVIINNTRCAWYKTEIFDYKQKY
jgi:hypothetical protein